MGSMVSCAADRQSTHHTKPGVRSSTASHTREQDLVEPRPRSCAEQGAATSLRQSTHRRQTHQVGDKGLRNPLRAEQVRPLQAWVKRGDGWQVVSHCGGRSRCGCGSWGCWLRLCLRLLLCCCGSGWWWLRQSLQLFPLPLRLCWLLLLLLLKHALAGVESGHGGVVAAEAGPSNGLEGAPLHTAEDAALGFVAHRTGVTVPFPRRDLLHAVAHLPAVDPAVTQHATFRPRMRTRKAPPPFFPPRTW
eukprot:scaffold4084_cov290-Prasinococcus_capsulatus_cf.AAC.1